MEPVPAAAHTYFGQRLPSAVRYAALLSGPGVEWGLLGPREVDRLWSRHLLNCAALATFLPPGAVDVLDVGSGAGLPGIVLALASPSRHVTLLEPLQRRVRFLELCVRTLELTNVDIIADRAQAVAGRVSADVVVARAVAPLDRLVGWTWPLVRPGGALLAVKGAAAEEEVSRLGALPVDIAGPPEVARHLADDDTVLVTVVRLQRAAGPRTGRRGRATR